MLPSLLVALLALAAPCAGSAQTAPPREFARSVIVDTDAGPDDLMALAFVLRRVDVRVEAITVGAGLAHVAAGARNVLRLLALAGRSDIPVYPAQEERPAGAEFPAEWRRISDELPGVALPAAARPPERRGAAEFLAERFAPGQRPFDLLALGPLTTLAAAFKQQPNAAATIRSLVIMGGAVRVPGNVGEGGITGNDSAEWNVFVDAGAARTVFASGASIRLVPLDATRRIPVDMTFLRDVRTRAKSPLGRMVAQMLGTAEPQIRAGHYFAWDPLAAAALVDASIVRFAPLRIEVRQNAPERGRTVAVDGAPNAMVALDADPARFHAVFIGAFER